MTKQRPFKQSQCKVMLTRAQIVAQGPNPLEVWNVCCTTDGEAGRYVRDALHGMRDAGILGRAPPYLRGVRGLIVIDVARLRAALEAADITFAFSKCSAELAAYEAAKGRP